MTQALLTKVHHTCADSVLASAFTSDYASCLPWHHISQSDVLCPGAIFIDWTQDGIDHDASDTPVQLQTDSSIFAAEMQAKGISTDRPVVVASQAFMCY